MNDNSDNTTGASVRLGTAKVVEPNSTQIFTLADTLNDDEWRVLIRDIFPALPESKLPQQIESFKKTAIRLKPYQKCEIHETTTYLICKGKLRVHITQDEFLEYERKEILIISPSLPGIWMGGPHGVVLIEVKSSKVVEQLFKDKPESVVSLPRLEDYLKGVRLSGSGSPDDDDLSARVQELEEQLKQNDDKIDYLIDSIEKMHKFFGQVLDRFTD